MARARLSLHDLGRSEAALTIDVLAADGELPASEFDYLRRLKQHLRLTDAQYERARSLAS